MAITRDQPSALFAAGGTTAAVTWSVNPTAGSKVLLAFTFPNAVTVSSVKDNGTSQTTFTQDLNNGRLFFFRGDNISLPSSGSYIVTITLSGAGGGTTAFGYSYLGVKSGGPTSSNSGTGTSTSVATGSATPAAAGALFFGAFEDSSSANPETITLTGSGFIEEATQTNGATLVCGGFADKIDSGGPTATPCTWTLGDSVAWVAGIVTYDAASVPSAQYALPGKTWKRRFSHHQTQANEPAAPTIPTQEPVPFISQYGGFF